ncbi:MAG: GNAT family N-acetyltransferase [Mariprofundaceae bacterium]|nr:GNAT family N-acetyltransferase [Mariprofundaceae bacterium]
MFLQKHAIQFHEENIATTYVLVSRSDRPDVYGYITLVSSEIRTNGDAQLTEIEQADRYDTLPGVKIARLAIHKDCQGNGYGGEMVSFAVATIATKVMPFVGCRFVIVDSKPDAVGKYEEWGFTMLDTEENRFGSHPLLYIDLYRLFQEEG